MAVQNISANKFHQEKCLDHILTAHHKTFRQTSIKLPAGHLSEGLEFRKMCSQGERKTKNHEKQGDSPDGETLLSVFSPHECSMIVIKLNRCHVCVWYSDLCVHICGAAEQLLND